MSQENSVNIVGDC